jgi:hypothetical protein
MTIPSRGTLPGAEHTLFRGYGPFAALLALILAMAFLAPTIAPEREVMTHGRPSAVDCPAAAAVPPDLRSFATDGCRR